MKKLFLLFLIITSMVFAYESSQNDIKESSLTIYNDNFAVVREKRDTDVKRDDDYIIYKDVAKLIEPDSVMVDGVDIKELNYEYDLLNKNKLLEKYIGEKIFIYDRESSKKKEYRLLSVMNGVVVEDMESGEVLLDPEGMIVLPKNIDGLKLKPSLVWKIRKGSARDEIGVSYITKGINWQAKYVVNVKEKYLDLTAWVDLDNRSGKTYKNSSLKLIAGDVKRVKEPVSGRKILMKSYMANESYNDAGFEEKEFFDYHMYTLAGKVDIKNNQSKQMELLKAENVKYDKYYSIEGSQENASIILKIENRKDNRLGIALPKGKVKVYKEDEDSSLEFVGEDSINHSPKDEILRLDIGKAFDIKNKYTELSNKKTGKNSYEREVEYTVSNHKNEKAGVELIHRLYGDWEILKSSEDYIKESSDKIVFNLVLDKNEEKTVKIKYVTYY